MNEKKKKSITLVNEKVDRFVYVKRNDAKSRMKNLEYANKTMLKNEKSTIRK